MPSEKAEKGKPGDLKKVRKELDGRRPVGIRIGWSGGGGHFVTIKIGTVTNNRMLLAEFDVSGTKPALLSFSTRFVTSYPGVWALASTTQRLYVGGDFTAAGQQVNGKNVDPYFAMFPVA